jgi:hypothetical protein
MEFYFTSVTICVFSGFALCNQSYNTNESKSVNEPWCIVHIFPENNFSLNTVFELRKESSNSVANILYT